ncbi:predicted protein [Nematostella vectensis]|uniref:Uncharacterized protein n=1 Tax=Nematostella vectensis TaxID=45351 RepID=A7RHD1_NEMVE|nr:predicted protein [Nematostella vectensis]|eukprot:XP_001641272.1 predicted protein [Nematostella vectensis]
MGCATSQPGQVQGPGYEISLPVDNVPYRGPSIVYLLCKVPVQMASNAFRDGATSTNETCWDQVWCRHIVDWVVWFREGGLLRIYKCFIDALGESCRFPVSFGFSAGRPMVSSNIDSYYPTLAQFYQQGYIMNTFYNLPMAVQQSGFAKMTANYEAIFSKPGDGSPPEGGVQYDLRVEKSMVHVRVASYGIIGGQSTVGETSDLIQKIAHYSSQGARLICIEATGYMQSQGFSAGMAGVGPGIGVDLFFNVPRHPPSTTYCYQAVSIPITATVHPGFTVSVEAQCDWMGNFAAYLNQGWKLIEIFIDKGYKQQGAFSMTYQVNAMWFFEKEASRLHDNTPLYEGTIIHFQHQLKDRVSFTSDANGFSKIFNIQRFSKGWLDQWWFQDGGESTWTCHHLTLLSQNLTLLSHHLPLLSHHLPLLSHHNTLLSHHLTLLSHHLPLLSQNLTLLSHHLTLLSHHLTLLSHHLTLLSHYLTQLSHHLTQLIHHLNLLSHHLTLLSHHLTLLSHHLPLLSQNLTLLSHHLTLLSQNLTLLSHHLPLLSHYLTQLSHHLTQLIHHLNLLSHHLTLLSL